MGGGESSTGAQGGEESDPIHGYLTLTPVSQVQVRNEPHAPRSLSYSSSLPPPQPMLPRHLRRQFPQRILMTHAAALLGLMTPRPSNGDGETTRPHHDCWFLWCDGTSAHWRNGRHSWTGTRLLGWWGWGCRWGLLSSSQWWKDMRSSCSNANASPSAPCRRSRARRWANVVRAPAARRMVKERLPRESLADHAVDRWWWDVYIDSHLFHCLRLWTTLQRLMIIVTERCFLYAFQDEPIKDPKPLEIMHLELCRLKKHP